MSENLYRCTDCYGIISQVTDPEGVIFVREREPGSSRFEALPVCTPDWQSRNGSRIPIRVRWTPLLKSLGDST